MKFDSPILELSATPFYLLLFCAAAIFVFHIIYVWWKPLDDIGWKRADYWWLSAAAMGLLISSAQLERHLSQVYLENMEVPRTETAYELLRNHFQFSGGLCLPRDKAKSTNEDFDLIVKEHQELCQKSGKVAAAMPPVAKEPFLTPEGYGYAPFGDRYKFDGGFVKETDIAVAQYRNQQERYAQLSSASVVSVWEQILVAIGPILLALALALRITKVSGEIKNARARAANNSLKADGPDGPPP